MSLDFHEYYRCDPMPVPATPEELYQYSIYRTNGGASHSQWVNSRPSQNCYSTTFAPNTKLDKGTGIPTNWINSESRVEEVGNHDCRSDCLCFGLERSKPPVYAIPARSNHHSLVQVVMADATVRSIHDSVDLRCWRAIATRSGGERDTNCLAQ